MALTSMGAEIKFPSGNVSHCFWIHGQIYHFFSLLYSNEANKPEYGEFDPAETTRWLENLSDQ
jgi:hypothetical protein